MAAGVNTPNADAASVVLRPRVVVDTPRLARVATWPAGWTPGLSAAQVAHALGPQRPSVTLTGSEVAVRVDNHVRGDFRQLGLSLAILDDDGVAREISVGPYPRGASTATARLPACRHGCQLQTISFGGPSALVEAMHGTATIDSFTVDGRSVPGALDAPWRAADSQVGTPRGVRTPPTLADGRLTVSFDAGSSSYYAGIGPTDVPAVVPVLWGRTAAQETRLQTGSSGLFRVRSVGTAESLPFRGPSGVLIDFTMFARNTTQDNSTNQVYVWARADTPRSVLDRLAARGLTHPVTESAARDLLGQDAFALALRLYAVVTVLVILLAFAGLAANLAVQLPSRRRDAASLRVVGVKRRSIMVGRRRGVPARPRRGRAGRHRRRGTGPVRRRTHRHARLRRHRAHASGAAVVPRRHRLRARDRGDARPAGARLGLRGPHGARRPYLLAAGERALISRRAAPPLSSFGPEPDPPRSPALVAGLAGSSRGA